MAETAKTKVTFIQSKDGVTRTARIGDTTVEVVSAGPTMQNGEIVAVLTIRNVDLSAEMASEEAPGA